MCQERPALCGQCVSFSADDSPRSRLPIGKYKTASLHLSGSSPCGLAQPMSLHYTPPFAPSAFADFIATTECSALWRRVRTLALVVHTTCGFSVSIGAEGSHVPNNRLTRAQTTYIPDTVPRKQVSSELVPQPSNKPQF